MRPAREKRQGKAERQHDARGFRARIDSGYGHKDERTGYTRQHQHEAEYRRQRECELSGHGNYRAYLPRSLKRRMV